ncbi:hypothetical protein GCM10007860_13630 [Chitiniphilus shinanonensis]|uniref:Uncharacterized protein n=1 Tax=Chitiniphilus shinanonensis TaxID=553088 RepID=A0ABQ6BS82_9NEIS|nr:hypothetical protein [Chitiniphilus shinanonensis]GLS04217.1 hypothetical protein GCM10007860_13630 [Chitiniphilus shinanonensis]
MSEPSRFGLDGVTGERARIEAAKAAARSPENRRSVARLTALANLPWVIALVIWLVAKYL